MPGHSLAESSDTHWSHNVLSHSATPSPLRVRAQAHGMIGVGGCQNVSQPGLSSAARSGQVTQGSPSGTQRKELPKDSKLIKAS